MHKQDTVEMEEASEGHSSLRKQSTRHIYLNFMTYRNILKTRGYNRKDNQESVCHTFDTDKNILWPTIDEC